ncbi:alpha-N-acetylglucosaminidase C-terminal domain-containing protein [Streptomyces violaceus]|uniref:Alpha-N-acetylglucosaminidase C-terminal domain-containing protein n=1 Tax=Streptomyces violaceus TaxID=1936 RepID=A0ABZ1P312_STRVL
MAAPGPRRHNVHRVQQHHQRSLLDRGRAGDRAVRERCPGRRRGGERREPQLPRHDGPGRVRSGLVGGLYRTRWNTYFDALTTGKDPATIDWFALEDRRAHAHETHPTEPQGSPYALARRVRDLLAATPHQAVLTAGTDRGAVAEGTPDGDGHLRQQERVRGGTRRGPLRHRSGGHGGEAARSGAQGVGGVRRDVRRSLRGLSGG